MLRWCSAPKGEVYLFKKLLSNFLESVLILKCKSNNLSNYRATLDFPHANTLFLNTKITRAVVKHIALSMHRKITVPPEKFSLRT